jgi:hypothetical protein
MSSKARRQGKKQKEMLTLKNLKYAKLYDENPQARNPVHTTSFFCIKQRNE